MIANLEYYKVFYYAVKCGSVTRASEELSLSQPAVSQSLKQLERILGIRLLKRSSRGISPTAEGQLLFSFVEKGYEQFEAGEKRLLQIRNLERGEITIGASDMTLRFFLLPWLERFHEIWPGIKVTVTNGPTPATMALLREGKIDFGVISGPLEEEEGIRMRPVQQIEDIFVIGRKFSKLKEGTHPIRILEELPLIMIEPRTSTRKYVQGFLESRGVTVSPEFELATSDMIVQFAIRNLGVGSVVRNFAEEQLRAGTLNELKFRTPIPPRDFLLVTSERDRAGLAASRLLEMIFGKEKG
ncbi:MAG: LysR family transcriptional regulator [Clostridiales bacterium]|nr:MAG: LysR family transcriptional regulator [Clostridiales bacterium]